MLVLCILLLHLTFIYSLNFLIIILFISRVYVLDRLLLYSIIYLAFMYDLKILFWGERRHNVNVFMNMIM